jgi:hypothetical protein
VQAPGFCWQNCWLAPAPPEPAPPELPPPPPPLVPPPLVPPPVLPVLGGEAPPPLVPEGVEDWLELLPVPLLAPPLELD